MQVEPFLQATDIEYPLCVCPVPGGAQAHGTWTLPSSGSLPVLLQPPVRPGRPPPSGVSSLPLS